MDFNQFKYFIVDNWPLVLSTSMLLLVFIFSSIMIYIKMQIFYGNIWLTEKTIWSPKHSEAKREIVTSFAYFYFNTNFNIFKNNSKTGYIKVLLRKFMASIFDLWITFARKLMWTFMNVNKCWASPERYRRFIGFIIQVKNGS